MNTCRVGVSTKCINIYFFNSYSTNKATFVFQLVNNLLDKQGTLTGQLGRFLPTRMKSTEVSFVSSLRLIKKFSSVGSILCS